MISDSLSGADAVNGFLIASCTGILSGIDNPEYECAELFHLCEKEGITVVALKSNAEIPSPKYLILSVLPPPGSDAVAEPKVLLLIIPYGLSPFFFHTFVLN